MKIDLDFALANYKYEENIINLYDKEKYNDIYGEDWHNNGLLENGFVSDDKFYCNNIILSIINNMSHLYNREELHINNAKAIEKLYNKFVS